MSGSDRNVRVWDWQLRLFHWMLVLSLALAFLSSEEDSALNPWHVLAGWVAGLLIVFRLVWGFIGGEHSRFSDFIRPSRIAGHVAGLLRGRAEPSLGHNPLGAVAVVVLLGLAGTTVWTGAFGGEEAEELHEVIAWALLAMIALHIAAVAIMSYLERENLARAMVTGDKPRARHPDARDARAPGIAATLVALAVIAAAAYAVLRYDPQAFTLRSAESFEHRDAGPPGPSRDSRAEEEHESD